MKGLLIVILIVLVVVVGYHFYRKPVVSDEDFTSINTFPDPEQYQTLDNDKIKINRRGLEAQIEPVAKYKVSAVVLSKKRYVSGWSAIISPLDLALGWGAVAQRENLDHIKTKQTLRWYRYRYDSTCTIGSDYISSHSSNHHIIPANKNIRKAVLFAKVNQEIVLDGYLVNVSGKFKARPVSWNTSKTRTDTGDRSCEIMFVTSVRLGTNIYR
ncbi:MAG: hypothetical protein K9N07_07970 [Candidatus Cloacimonetes bacterium]|nr:hypothetical protein [Candidatus Cloacimonadota bacterium]